MNTDLGQHFLIDQTVLDSIIAAAQLNAIDRVVEIGPGVGVLTKELLERTAHVTAIELDPRMLPLIEQYVADTVSKDEIQVTNLYSQKDSPRPVASDQRLHIINANALHVPFPKEPYKVVANIPYHITSPLLRHAFLESDLAPTTMTLLIQREVAEKICDDHDRSLLTIIVGLFGKPRIVRMVPPSAFLPPPKVDSAVLHIDCYSAPLTDAMTMEKVFTLTKHAFSQKRKMLRNTVSNLPGGNEAMEKAGIDITRRPQTLSIAEWITLAQAIA